MLAACIVLLGVLFSG